MKIIQAIICSALSISFIGSAENTSAQSVSVQTAAEWSCEVGECDLKWAPPSETSSSQSCVSEQRNFFIERIENASSGPHSGSFNFVGRLADEASDARTLDSYHDASKERGYLKDMILTVHAPDSIAGVSVRLLDASGNFLGTQIKDGTNKTVVFWSHDNEHSSDLGQTIQFEIQGNAVAREDAEGYIEPTNLWLNIFGTRCDVL